MSDAVTTKRLHISGLTPAITASDLHNRLSSFGIVKSIDGFGLKNGLGDPRKFIYATVEGRTKDLSKCVNVLSGTTWKGARLRLGDAKPDYRQRLSKERDAEESPPKKKRRISKYGGVESKDMSLVTPDNMRSGWKMTSAGKMLRPMKMRPAKPLPPMLESAATTKNKDVATPKRRKRVKLPPVRARRRLIDVTRWGGERISGVFLGGTVIPAQEDGSPSEDEEIDALQPIITPSPERFSIPSPTSPKEVDPFKGLQSDEHIDIHREKATSLTLLQSLFSNGNWMGREEPGSDIEVDMEKNARSIVNAEGGDDDFETVPMDVDQSSKHVAFEALQDTDSEEGEDTRHEEESQTLRESQHTQESSTKSSSTKLKDLFAPSEGQGNFSLLSHLDLDLDLELDEDVPFETNPASAVPSWEEQATTVHFTQPASQTSQFTLDPRQPLFFPMPADPSSRSKYRGARDLFSIQFAPGRFYRTGTEDEIKKRWEDRKVELTRGWKKRCKEAGKVRRRRGGDMDGDL